MPILRRRRRLSLPAWISTHPEFFELETQDDVPPAVALVCHQSDVAESGRFYHHSRSWASVGSRRAWRRRTVRSSQRCRTVPRVFGRIPRDIAAAESPVLSLRDLSTDGVVAIPQKTRSKPGFGRPRFAPVEQDIYLALCLSGSNPAPGREMAAPVFRARSVWWRRSSRTGA